jgi:NAD+ diphosphatase
MFQDLDIRYDNSFRRETPASDSLALICRGDAVLAKKEDGLLTLPSFAELTGAPEEGAFRYAFTLGDRSFFLADWEKTETPLIRPSVRTGAPSPEEEGFGFVPSREYRGMGPKETVFAAAVGESLHRWYGGNRFCGRCGTAMADSETERARVCPACGLTVYPKISPAVIVAVTDGDRLLLTKYRGRAFKRFALVAGFNEIGESIEDTVRREVLEETGVRVKNLRFYKSQPWVFTDSLLMGFFCELDGSDRVTIQENELSEAGWYPRDEIPADYSPISLTGEMIDRFRRGEAIG